MVWLGPAAGLQLQPNPIDRQMMRHGSTPTCQPVPPACVASAKLGSRAARADCSRPGSRRRRRRPLPQPAHPRHCVPPIQINASCEKPYKGRCPAGGLRL
jgi:hypothetical protein